MVQDPSFNIFILGSSVVEVKNSYAISYVSSQIVGSFKHCRKE